MTERPISEDEVRICGALAHHESAVREPSDKALKKFAHELADKLRKCKYPPDQQDAAVERVLQQAKALGEASG